MKRQLVHVCVFCGSHVRSLMTGDPLQCYWPTSRVCKVLTFPRKHTDSPFTKGQINTQTHTSSLFFCSSMADILEEFKGDMNEKLTALEGF